METEEDVGEYCVAGGVAMAGRQGGLVLVLLAHCCCPVTLLLFRCHCPGCYRPGAVCPGATVLGCS